MSKTFYKPILQVTEIICKIKATQAFMVINTSNILKLVITPEGIRICTGVMSSLQN